MDKNMKKYIAKSREEQEFLDQYNPGDYETVSITADAVVFGIMKAASGNYRKRDQQSLKILLVKRDEYPYKECYSLPGGFIFPLMRFSASSRMTLWSKANCIFCASFRSNHCAPLTLTFPASMREI